MKTKNSNPALQRAMDSTPDLPIRTIHVGTDAAARLAAFVDAGPVLVVSDEQTREASSLIFSALSSRSITEHVYPADGFDGTGALAENLTTILPDAAWIVGVGSGTVCDLAKYAGHLMGVPVALYGTAASMNGYTSGIAALKVRGLKRTLPCTPASGVFADPAVLAAAPQKMAAAGLADFLSKCSACADWRAANLLRGETFREDALQFYEGLVDRVIEDAPKIGEGDPVATAFLMEALLLSGLSMLVAGSSSPASGGEHLISHYIDMKSALNGTSHDLHGAQVGVATVHCLRLWEQVIALDPAQVDAAACAKTQPRDAEIRSRIIETWGDDISAEVLEQWAKKSRDSDGIQAEIERFCDQHATLTRAVAQDVLPAATVEAAIAAAGGPTRPEALNASIDDYNAALENARFIRSRFTVLDLAAELRIG
jgi:glycerol-1-phosphate dehydrogenase [NAD(P)+]